MEQNNTVLYIPCKLMTTAANLQLANAAQLWDEYFNLSLDLINRKIVSAESDIENLTQLVLNCVKTNDNRQLIFDGSVYINDGYVNTENLGLTINDENTNVISSTYGTLPLKNHFDNIYTAIENEVVYAVDEDINLLFT